jgi:hypothetical protein
MVDSNESVADTARDSLDTLREDIAVLRTDVAQIMKDLAGSGYRAVKDRVAGAGELAGEYAGAARDKAGEMHEKLAEQAGQRPLTYLALAFAAGAIASRLLGARK